MAITQVTSGGLVLAADQNNALSKRVGENSLTVNSVSVASAANTVVNTLTVPLLTGQTYALRWTGRVSGTVANDIGYIRIRPTSAAGTEYVVSPVLCPTNYAGGFALDSYCEFVAPATATYTFVVTLQVGAGTGPVAVRSSASGPSVFTCDYVGY